MFSVSPNMKPSEKIRQLKIMTGSIFTRILFAGPEDEPLYILKPGAIDLLQWVNEKILFVLPDYTDYRTIEVRIRIATSMLNNLERDGVLTKEVCLMYHDRFTTNLRKIISDINTEDLPF